MKNIVIISISLLILFGCKDSEILPKSYPIVVMQDVSIYPASVDFTATFIGLGNVPINNFGFIWSVGNSLDSTNLFLKEIESIPAIGYFSLHITSDLEDGTVYTVRPFAKTESLTVLGDAMTFESKGSNLPKLDDFFPKMGN